MRPTTLLAGVLFFTGLLTPWPQSSPPTFNSPYASGALENFLVFSAAPRADIPDGQAHWVDMEVPGIDVLGPDGQLHSMCPGLAWSLASGDPYGGGTFVAVECQGAAQGWQMLAFHLCELKIGTSIDNAHRSYTQVPAGAVLAGECGHTHLSLGYWADPAEKRALPCPQWYVQGRYWVNPICLAAVPSLSLTLLERLDGESDWELRYLTPAVLKPLRQLALAIVMLGLFLYMLTAFTRPWKEADGRPATSPAFEPLVKSGVWLGFLVLLVLVSFGPVWPVNGAGFGLYVADAAGYQALARQSGYGDWRLLAAFYAAAVPRAADGRPAAAGQPGKVFPPEAAAVIPYGETDASEWGAVDPSAPGTHGAYLAWEAVAERWPVSWYERSVLGLDVSRTAQQQRDGLEAIALSPDIQRLGERLGKTIRAQDLYGSSAGAVGRTQILPEYFAPGNLCGDLPAKDIWNDPTVVAECTTRHLAVSGCWGRWWDTGDVWSALCGYNPGAWDNASDQWYWDLLRDKMTRLTAAQTAQPLSVASVIPVALDAQHVSTPVLGLLAAQAVLDEGLSADRLPTPLAGWVRQAGPVLAPQRAAVRVVFRLFRAWALIYYPPETLVGWGVQW